MNLRFLWLNFTIAVCLTTSAACSMDRSTGSTVESGTGAIEASSAQIEPVSTQKVPVTPASVASVFLPPETQAVLATLGDRPLFNPPRGDVRLVVISDLNSAYGATDYDPEVDKGMALIPFWQPDLVLCSGDMVAGQSSSLSAGQIRAMWAAFDDHLAAVLRGYQVPFGFTVGNHDASSARGSSGGFVFQQERDLAAEYWNAPEHDPGLVFVDRFEFPFYYTFEHKGIFFLVWDGSSDTIPPEKLQWVEAALASDRAQQAKMRVVLGHLPLYGVAIGRDKPGEVFANADQLRELLERYRVHTYISGHQHAYYPGHRGDLQLLHTGILGSGPRALISGDLPPFKAITVVDINFTDPDLTTYTTYDIKTLALIETETLPRFLTGHNGAVLRRDLDWQDLDSAEQANCEAVLGAARCGASEDSESP